MMEDRSESPLPSMTLAISRYDAQRMMESSRALNKRLRILQNERADHFKHSAAPADNEVKTEEPDSAPIDVISTSDDATVITKGDCKLSEGSRPFHELVVEAAMSCEDALIGSFISTVKERSRKAHVIQTSLLLFLDMDKSDKLSAAFELLSKLARERSSCSSKEEACDQNPIGTEHCAGVKIDSYDSKSNVSSGIDQDGAITLFRCFLTAISSCIQSKEQAKSASKVVKDQPGPPAKAHKQTKEASPKSPSQTYKSEENSEGYDNLEIPRSSPSFDSAMDTSIASLVSLPPDTLREIDEIASFASEKLIQFAKEKQQGKENPLISFETFGDWYNSKGFMVVPWLELMDLAKWDITTMPAPELTTNLATQGISDSNFPQLSELSPVNFFVDSRGDDALSRTLVSFDFTGTVADGGKSQATPLCINITEKNLVTLKSLVYRTGLISRSPDEIIDILLGQATKCYIGGKEFTILEKNDFGRCIRQLVPVETSTNFSREEMEQFSNYFMTIFGCYEKIKFGKSTVDAKELAVGFSVLCAGSKSVKLASGFDLLDKTRDGLIQQGQLSKYIRSYLTMLVGISVLSSTPEKTSSTMQKGMESAVENGAKWTLGHFKKSSGSDNSNTFTFETFAQWYTEGGYNVAPWLELLDLSKLLALLDDPIENLSRFQVSAPRGRGEVTSSQKRNPFGPVSGDILFTFPLAKGRSLVVLREDATYVRSVVEKLGLLSINPNEMWDSLFKSVKAMPPPPTHPWHRGLKGGKSMDVNQATFVRCMEEIVIAGTTQNKRLPSGTIKHSGASITETIANFFQSFDLDQVDRVALNQLMGGLSLLCGGKKSTKLAFSFGLFDGRESTKGITKSLHASLNGEELFLFLRSFLIVMFSCCRQSLDLSAEAVSRYISDTSHMVAEDVMEYQWHTRKRDRVDFDDFGEWYNEGGFETAPWLELLDLKKWVLVDSSKIQSRQGPTVLTSSADHTPRDGYHHYCPPPPPEDSVDPSFFGDDDNALMPMDSIDEMDLLLMAQPSHDKENDGNFMHPTSPNPRLQSHGRASNSLKFHLVTQEKHGGYMLSVSQKRVRHLRKVLTDSGLHMMDAEGACRKILNKASRVHGKLVLTRDDFDSAIVSILAKSNSTHDLRGESQRILSELFSSLFSIFDRRKNGAPSAIEVACGFTVICDGKKSDKLEFAFDVLDENRDGKLSREEMTNYLRSFLSVLLCVSTCSYLEADCEDNFLLMSGKPVDTSVDTIAKAAKAGSEWAANQAFKACFANGKSEEELSFDDFADWYTRKGFGSIPWLELLDLRKWVLT